MKLADYLILALVALALFLVIRRSVKRKAAGAACGCGGCAGCSARENCAEKTKSASGQESVVNSGGFFLAFILTNVDVKRIL